MYSPKKLAGFCTRLAAFGIAVNMVMAVAMVHAANGFFMNWHGTLKGEGFEYNLLAAGIALAVMIKSGGEWVSSLQLEDLILRHPGVAEVAVIGAPDPKWGERPLALVVAKPGQGVDEAQLRSQLREFAAEGIIPRY